MVKKKATSGQPGESSSVARHHVTVGDRCRFGLVRFSSEMKGSSRAMQVSGAVVAVAAVVLGVSGSFHPIGVASGFIGFAMVPGATRFALDSILASASSAPVVRSRRVEAAGKSWRLGVLLAVLMSVTFTPGAIMGVAVAAEVDGAGSSIVDNVAGGLAAAAGLLLGLALFTGLLARRLRVIEEERKVVLVRDYTYGGYALYAVGICAASKRIGDSSGPRGDEGVAAGGG